MNNEKHSCKGCCKEKDILKSQTCSHEHKDEKNEGYNSWDSVPTTYDAEESCHKHEKTATNNQWCSCNK